MYLGVLFKFLGKVYMINKILVGQLLLRSYFFFYLFTFSISIQSNMLPMDKIPLLRFSCLFSYVDWSEFLTAHTWCQGHLTSNMILLLYHQEEILPSQLLSILVSDTFFPTNIRKYYASFHTKM